MGEFTEKAKGIANEAAGNAKQAAGKATDNERLRAEGEAQERKGEAQNLKGKVQGALGDKILPLARHVSHEKGPGASLSPGPFSLCSFKVAYLPPDATRSTSVIAPSRRIIRT